jgi:hypothetical protein
MVADMTTVKGDVPDFAFGATSAGDALLPWIREFEGYEGMIVMIDEETRTARFITFWEDEDALKRSAKGRKEVREQLAKTAGVEIESSQPYRVQLLDGFQEPGARGT